MDAERTVLRNVINWQVRLSHKFDTWLPEKYRVVGRQYFRSVVLPRYLMPEITIYDVGGGSAPCLTPEHKKSLGANIVGLDIAEEELAKAPEGVYDTTVVADITGYTGTQDADLVVCQATLEHVRDTSEAFRAFSTILRAGGRLLVVVPSRNAVFARINLMLPEKFKRRILFSIFPHKGLGHDGFPAYYNRCTPRDFRRMAAENGFEVEVLVPHFYSSYFTFFTPLFILWRLWIVTFAFVRGEQAAEVFSMVCRRKSEQSCPIL